MPLQIIETVITTPKQDAFLSEDPIGFDDRDTNFYRYVENNSINFVDPYGESLFNIVGRALLRYAVRCAIRPESYICKPVKPYNPFAKKPKPKPQDPYPVCDPSKQSCLPLPIQKPEIKSCQGQCCVENSIDDPLQFSLP